MSFLKAWLANMTITTAIVTLIGIFFHLSATWPGYAVLGAFFIITAYYSA